MDDRSDEVFEPDRLLEIEIELKAADWDYLRRQGRNLSTLAEGCRDGPPPRVFEYFPATVTIDGQTLDRVGVRKKGFLGSNEVTRPSLKLKFDQYERDQRFMGMQRMTLNNNREDLSKTRTCLAYRFYAHAGIAAPRCNHARVRINGDDLGIYAHVESLKKPFLARHFSDVEGRLYEAQRSDFRPVWVNTFEIKTNQENTDRSDLEALTAALQVDDEFLLAEIDPLVDVEEFYTFWAVENLLGVWDGYSNDLNNYYVYHSLDDDRFHFIPWGIDVAYTLEFALNFGRPRPRSISASGMLANRLYHLAGGDVRYVDRMRELLDTVWSEEDLLQEVDRIEGITAPYSSQEDIQQIRDFIQNRRNGIEAEFGNGPPAWDFPIPGEDCFVTASTVTGSFSTTWDSMDFSDPFGAGDAELRLELNGVEQNFIAVGAQAGMDQYHGPAQPSIRVIGLRQDMTVLVVAIFTEEALFMSPSAIPFLGFSTFGGVVQLDQSYNYNLIGFVSAGTITLNRASMVWGERISGSFAGKLFVP